MPAHTGRMQYWLPDVVERLERGEVLTSKKVAEDYHILPSSSGMALSILRLAGFINGTLTKGRDGGRGYYFYHL